MSNPINYGSEFSPAIDPTQKIYHLKAKPKIIRTSAQQGILGGKSETQVVVLALANNDETGRFFAAWLPNDENHQVEVLCIMGHPIYGSCRMSVHRGNKLYNVPHLFVMTKAVEDILIERAKTTQDPISFVTEPGLADAGDDHESDRQETSISIQRTV